jgi:hypothetical protein
MEVELRLNPKLISCSSSFKVASEEIDSFLQGLVKLGVISETDKYILLATKVYGKSMKDISQELKGISYENIRQRKVRIAEKIQRYFYIKVNQRKN